MMDELVVLAEGLVAKPGMKARHGGPFFHLKWLDE